MKYDIKNQATRDRVHTTNQVQFLLKTISTGGSNARERRLTVINFREMPHMMITGLVMNMLNIQMIIDYFVVLNLSMYTYTGVLCTKYE